MLRLLAILLICGSTLSATPIKPKIEDVLKNATKPRNDYPVARVGWDKPVAAKLQRNPIYEQMRYPYTREGLLAQFVSVSIPDWRILGLFGLLIFTLRYYRHRAPRPLVGQATQVAAVVDHGSLERCSAERSSVERAA